MRALTRPLIALSLLLAGCGEGEKVVDDSPAAQPPGERLGDPDEDLSARPVLIGEGGPRFDACQALGRVQGLRGGTLAVHNAPFDRAAEAGTLEEGARVFICTRSIDQQWLGVVIPGSGEDAPDCGVTSPVRTKRNYDGPCASGWVESNFVQLIAG